MEADHVMSAVDVVNVAMQVGSLILLGFVFYTVMQVAKVVREEFKDKQEQRFERWYNEKILAPRHPVHPLQKKGPEAK